VSIISIQLSFSFLFTVSASSFCNFDFEIVFDR
jgi:hypothetical protein